MSSTVVDLGNGAKWNTSDVMVRLKDNDPFYMIADSPGNSDRARVTVEVREYSKEDLASPEFQRSVGLVNLNKATGNYASSTYDDRDSGLAVANVVTDTFVVTVRAQHLLSRSSAPVAAQDLAAVAQQLAQQMTKTLPELTSTSG